MNANINLNEIVSCIFNKPYYLSQITLVLKLWNKILVFKKSILTLFKYVFIVELDALTLRS